MTHAELEKLRDLAGKVMKGDMQFLIESLQYSPPVRPNPETGVREPSVSPVITGMKKPSGQQHRLTGGTTGEGQGGSGSMTGYPAGQAAGGT